VFCAAKSICARATLSSQAAGTTFGDLWVSQFTQRDLLFGVEKTQETSRQGDVRMDEFMNQPATSVRNHCLSPTRAKVAIDAPLGSTAYGRMFPELPSFEADEQFLHALGRAGGICDCGDVEDTPDSLGETAAGWPILGQFVAHNITADRSILQSHTNPSMRTPLFSEHLLKRLLSSKKETPVERHLQGIGLNRRS
jgi:hypothetical protein